MENFYQEDVTENFILIKNKKTNKYIIAVYNTSEDYKELANFLQNKIDEFYKLKTY